MTRFQPHVLIGVFALLTAGLAGVVVGHLLGLSAGDSVYLTILLLAFLGWLVGREARRQEQQ